jgi:hyperosmotically inducible periplasmic protein
MLASIHPDMTERRAKMRRFDRASHLQITLVSLFLLTALIPIQSAVAAGPAAPQGTAAEQAQIAKEVRHVLVLLPYYSVFDNLEYRIDGGKVTLLGQVVNPVLKDDAGRAVKRVEGVTQVDNQIEVLPLSPMDNRLRQALYRKIYSSPSLQKYEVRSVPPIHIIVKNGHVTLEGVVATAMDKQLAGLAANQVSGVFSVTNNLRLENDNAAK